ncbi:MAG: hypothetical protein AB7W16_06505 [Candidatus Obscuribacterales bacterium]
MRDAQQQFERAVRDIVLGSEQEDLHLRVYPALADEREHLLDLEGYYDWPEQLKFKLVNRRARRAALLSRIVRDYFNLSVPLRRAEALLAEIREAGGDHAVESHIEVMRKAQNLIHKSSSLLLEEGRWLEGRFDQALRFFAAADSAAFEDARYSFNGMSLVPWRNEDGSAHARLWSLCRNLEEMAVELEGIQLSLRTIGPRQETLTFLNELELAISRDDFEKVLSLKSHRRQAQNRLRHCYLRLLELHPTFEKLEAEVQPVLEEAKAMDSDPDIWMALLKRSNVIAVRMLLHRARTALKGIEPRAYGQDQECPRPQ